MCNLYWDGCGSCTACVVAWDEFGSLIRTACEVM
jgi:hypothetical protein